MPSDDLTRLARWLDAGGAWRVSRRSEGSVDLELVTCAGEEVMDAFRSEAADVLAYVSAVGAAPGEAARSGPDPRPQGPSR